MSTSYFFVRTPIQLYNAVEAKVKLCNETKCKLIILSDYPPTLGQFERLIDSKMWSEVLTPWGKYKKLTKFKLFNRLLNINRRISLKKILKGVLEHDMVFWGNYNSIWLRYFISKKNNSVTILDDGFATLSIPKHIKNHELFFNKNKSLVSFIEELLISSKNSIPLNRLHFFTSFKNISPLIDERATYTNYPFLKSQSRTDGPNQKTMYFIGQPLILLSILDKDTYVRNINSIFEYYEKKGMKCFYVPHRSAIHNYIPKNWNILNFNLPLEGLVFDDTQQLPKIMASFYSSALYYVNKFYQNKDMNFEYWEVNTLQSNSDIQHCYSYIKKEKLKNTIVHKLDA